jgi:GGDEF domain-containing protein
MAEAYRQVDLAVMQTGHAIKAEESLRDERGETFFLSVKFPTRSTEGEITGICGISTDITQIKHYQKELERLSQYDELTGLCNRRHFMGLARHELGRSQRYGGKLSLLMVDIDHFKRVNDSHGHRTGDLVLAAVSEQIRKALRDADIAGRLGGEEFAVMLPETASAAPFWSPSGCASRSRPRPSISATARHCSAPCRLAWPAWTTRRLTWKSCCTAPTRRFTAPRTAAATRSSATLRSSGVRNSPTPSAISASGHHFLIRATRSSSNRSRLTPSATAPMTIRAMAAKWPFMRALR